jgi:hypothetical protein
VSTLRPPSALRPPVALRPPNSLRRPGTLRQRRGTALVAAIIVLLLVECLVAGTVHLVMLDRRSAANAELALQLRSAAVSAAHTAAAHWTPALDTLLAPGGAAAVHGLASPGGTDVHAEVERLDGGLFLARATAVRAALPTGRATETLLFAAPVLRLGADPAAAALTAASVTLDPGSFVDAGNHACAPDAAAIRLPADGALLAAPGTVSGDVAAMDSTQSLVRDMARVRAAAAAAAMPAVAAAATVPAAAVTAASAAASTPVLHFAPADLRVTSAMDGAIVVTGNLVLTAGAHIRGVVLVGGTLTLEAGTTIEGAAHVADNAHIAGVVRLDGCLVRDAAAAAALHRPRPFPGRSSIPAF